MKFVCVFSALLSMFFSVPFVTSATDLTAIVPDPPAVISSIPVGVSSVETSPSATPPVVLAFDFASAFSEQNTLFLLIFVELGVVILWLFCKR